MNPRKRHPARRASARADQTDDRIAEEIHADDGAAAAERLFRKSFARAGRDDRKTLQLCGQVRRTLGLALAGDCADPVLQDLEVESVTPAPDATRLLVRVRLPHDTPAAAASPEAAADVLRRLARAHGRLRHAVAQAIVRKRAPELTFQVTGGREVGA